MNACEAEILALTKYTPRKKYKTRDEYLICLLRELDRMPEDKYMYLVSNQVHGWYEDAAVAFKGYKPLPELPDDPIEALRYPRDDEDYTPPPGPPELTPDEHRGNISAMLEAQDEAQQALKKLEEATDKVKPKRNSKYRLADPIEGARHYLFPEADRYGLLRGTKYQAAAEMMERGCTMREIKETHGHTMYNLVRKLVGQGHSVENAGGVFKLTHKDDLDANQNKR